MIASVLVSLTVTALSKVALCRWYIESHVEAAAVTEDVKGRGVEAPADEPAVQESKIITTTKKSILTKPKAKEE